ncbi:MAG TPA: hypothetical protein VJ909_03895, partial [Prolixibacteraceae bacterium]|nr:hypothetical protein [Prolixibacteraceae bacterium]
NRIKPELFHVHQLHNMNALIVEFPDEQIQNATVSICNMHGKRVSHEKMSGSPHIINVTNSTLTDLLS